MKRMILLALLISLMALPVQSVLADHEGPTPLPPACEPETVITIITNELENMQDIDDLMNLLELVITTTERCAEYWINFIVELLLYMQANSGMISGIEPAIPDVGEAEEATEEATVEAAGTEESTEETPGVVVVEGEPVYDPDDGIMTTDEAEFVIAVLGNGDVETANAYFCEDDQVDATEFAAVDISLTSVSCKMIAGKINCTIEGEINGEEFTETTLFTIVDGKLCTQTE